MVAITGNLDINTPKGQLTLPQYDEVVRRIKKRWPVDVIETDKTNSASFDNILVRDNILKAFCEIKCRDMSLKQMEAWGDTWLVTDQKIKDGQVMSKLGRVPFIGFLYLVPDDIILYWKITDKTGKYLFDFEVEKTETQYCINGGTIIRENAYLHRKFSKKL